MKVRKNTADFAVFPFNKANFEGFGAEPFDASRLVMNIVDSKPFAKLADEGVRYRSGRLDAVLFFYSAGRMAEFVREIAVVGKNDEAGGQKIEPANTVEPFVYFAWEQVAGKGAVLGVSLRTEKAGRFVQGKVV